MPPRPVLRVALDQVRRSAPGYAWAALAGLALGPVLGWLLGGVG